MAARRAARPRRTKPAPRHKTATAPPKRKVPAPRSPKTAAIRRPRQSDSAPVDDGLTIVGIGASAGGLEALTELVEALPGNTGLVIVVLQHMAPNHESALPYLLGPHSRTHVAELTDGMRLKPNEIYICPPNAQMKIYGDRVKLSPRPTDRSRHTPIDSFFASLALTAQTRAIAIVLSGTASDGAIGIRDVKAAGGITIAQRPDSARFDSMPRAAIATGMVDLVLTPAEVGVELGRISHHSYVRTASGSDAGVSHDSLLKIFELLKPISGVDFSHYKQATIRRRLTRRMALSRLDDVAGYIKLLQSSPDEARALFQDFLIHVTRFFREPESFALLGKEVFPKLLGRGPGPLRLWVCGCATGEEAYSLAICAVEFLEHHHSEMRVQIFATDVSETAIDHARTGVYPATIAADVNPARLRRFFTRTDGSYRVNKQIRDLCVFARQDLTKDPPFSRLDLIMCRNVLIYMDAQLQKRLIGMFHYALNADGYLMLGQAETVGGQASLFSVADKKHRIHRKKSVASMAPPEIPFSRHHEPALQRRGVAPRESERNLELDATRVILDRYAPPGVVVDADLQIVQFRGQTGPYLEPAPGEASLGLLKMAREGLLHGLRSALQTARKSGQAVRRDSVEVRINGEWRPVAIDVLPLTVQDRRYYLVLFDDSVAAQPPSPKPAAKRPATHKTAPKTDLLQRELAASRDYLQSIIQELEAANEELQSANEEILSSNEELQSTNEELDTAKEELQSTNEELNTVNEELQGRNDEISRANSDLVNLLGSVHIAIVIVGSDLRIRRFTPMAEKILNLIPGDVNRQIGHINPNIECPDLEQLIIDSIDSMNPIERDVRDKQGKWYSLRIRPYKNASNRIEGAVLALFDIDQLIRSQHRTQLALDLAGAIVGSAPVPSALLDRDLRVRIANESFAAIFGLAAPEVPGRTLTELGGKMWNITEWKQGLPSSRISLNAIVVDDSRERHWTLRGTVVKAHDEADGSMIMVVASEQL